jgi:hypothetical protein
MGILDITAANFDPRSGVFSATVMRHGRAHRSVYVATGGRQPVLAAVAGEPAELRVDRGVVAVGVRMGDRPAELRLTFKEA